MKRNINMEFIGKWVLYIYALWIFFFLLANDENVNGLEKCNWIQFGEFAIFYNEKMINFNALKTNIEHVFHSVQLYSYGENLKKFSHIEGKNSILG